MIKYKTFIIKTFDQVKNDNFDQVKFDQVSVSQCNQFLLVPKQSDHIKWRLLEQKILAKEKRAILMFYLCKLARLATWAVFF
jgi:hypothetical protein